MGEPANAEGYADVSRGRVWYRVNGIGRPGFPVLCLHGGPARVEAGVAHEA